MTRATRGRQAGASHDTAAPGGALTATGLAGLERGRAAFNRGEYFEAHELWEETWKELDGGERLLVQGLIQIAAGLHHLRQRRRRPAAALLRKGLDKVSRGALPPPVGARVTVLARDVARLLAELEAPGARVTSYKLLKL